MNQRLKRVEENEQLLQHLRVQDAEEYNVVKVRLETDVQVKVLGVWVHEGWGLWLGQRVWLYVCRVRESTKRDVHVCTFIFCSVCVINMGKLEKCKLRY